MEFKQHEIIEGVKYSMSPVNLFHTTATEHLSYMLRKTLDRGEILLTDVSLTPRGTALKFFPDVAIFSSPVHYNKNGTVKDIPWFIAEVVSPKTRDKDYSSKKEAYEKIGVEYYWIVDPYGKFVIVYHLNDSRKYVYAGTYQKFYQDEWEEMDADEKEDFPRNLSLSQGDLHINLHIDDVFVDLDERFVEEED